MKPGDLVKLDVPRQRAHGKVGLVIDHVVRDLHDWMKDSPKRFAYDVMVDGEIWRVTYDELLEQEDWGPDETG